MSTSMKSSTPSGISGWTEALPQVSPSGDDQRDRPRRRHSDVSQVGTSASKPSAVAVRASWRPSGPPTGRPNGRTAASSQAMASAEKRMPSLPRLPALMPVIQPRAFPAADIG